MQELASRARLTDDELDASCPGQLFVARRPVDPAAGRQEQLAPIEAGWDLHFTTVVLLKHQIKERGHVPLVATLCGFLVLGAEITDLRHRTSRDVALTLREPGPWFEGLRDRRLEMGRGRDFVIRGWRLHVGGAPGRAGMTAWDNRRGRPTARQENA